MEKPLYKILISWQALAIILLGFASGIPFTLIGSTLSAWYTEDGVNLIGIGLLSLIGQPYALKFIWAPFLDQYSAFKLGRRRGWLLTSQCALIVSIIVLGMLSPTKNPLLMGGVAMLISFFSATQDIASCGYLAEITKNNEISMLTSIYSAGYRIASIISGGGALVLSTFFNWHLTYFTMAGCMLVGIFTSLLIKEPQVAYIDKRGKSFSFNIIFRPFTELLRRYSASNLFFIILVLFTYKITDNLAQSINNTLLLRYLDYTKINVGTFNNALAVITSLAGTLIGGIVLRRLSLIRGLFYFGLMQSLAYISYIWLYLYGHTAMLSLIVVTAIDNFFNGLGNAAFMVFMFTLAYDIYAGTQLAIITAVMAMGRLWVGPTAAYLVIHIGWVNFFYFSVIIGILCLALIIPLKNVLLNK